MSSTDLEHNGQGVMKNVDPQADRCHPHACPTPEQLLRGKLVSYFKEQKAFAEAEIAGTPD